MKNSLVRGVGVICLLALGVLSFALANASESPPVQESNQDPQPTVSTKRSFSAGVNAGASVVGGQGLKLQYGIHGGWNLDERLRVGGFFNYLGYPLAETVFAEQTETQSEDIYTARSTTLSFGVEISVRVPEWIEGGYFGWKLGAAMGNASASATGSQSSTLARQFSSISGGTIFYGPVLGYERFLGEDPLSRWKAHGVLSYQVMASAGSSFLSLTLGLDYYL